MDWLIALIGLASLVWCLGRPATDWANDLAYIGIALIFVGGGLLEAPTWAFAGSSIVLAILIGAIVRRAPPRAWRWSDSRNLTGVLGLVVASLIFLGVLGLRWAG
jgi:hypothetical protein